MQANNELDNISQIALGCFQEFGLEAMTFWFNKLIGYVLELISCDNAVVDDTVIEISDAATSPVILTAPIRQTPESTTRSSRGPPVVVQPLVSHREFRNAD
jgi:hypothetical protein